MGRYRCVKYIFFYYKFDKITFQGHPSVHQYFLYSLIHGCFLKQAEQTPCCTKNFIGEFSTMVHNCKNTLPKTFEHNCSMLHISFNINNRLLTYDRNWMLFKYAYIICLAQSCIEIMFFVALCDLMISGSLLQ